MPGTARVLSDAARRTSAAVADDGRHRELQLDGLSHLLRWFIGRSRAADRPRFLRSYQLRNTQPLPNGKFRRTPIGVVIGDADYASLRKGSRTRSEPKPLLLGTLAADSSYLGYFRLPVPKDVDPYNDIFQRWINGEPHYMPLPEWTASPFGPAALQGRPPVRITLHHIGERFATEIMKRPQRAAFGRMLPDSAYRKKSVDATGLVELLRQDRYLQSAFAAHPDSDIWLQSCSVGQHEAQVIADAFKRNIHFSTGDVIPLDSGTLVDAVSDNSKLPFSVTDGMLRQFDSTLDSAPPGLREVGRVHGWSALAVYADADSLVPPIQTVTPK